MGSTRLSSSTRAPLEEVLKQGNDAKRKYFAGIRIRHPRVSATLRDMETLIYPESGTDIVLLVGPTGVGKTTLALSLHEQVLRENALRMDADAGVMPSIYMLACATGEIHFSWRAFYVDCLRQLREPMIDLKVASNVTDERLSLSPRAGTVIALRLALESALRQRDTSLAVVDEAVHLMSGVSGPKLQSQINGIKSLSQRGNCKVALVGSYDLLQIINLEAQTSRRTAVVHFGRYLSGNDRDVSEFCTALRSLQAYLPIVNPPDLQKYSDELMRSSVGCVGLLKETLQRMLSFTLNHGGKWDERHLQKALLTEKQVQSVLSDVIVGEKLVKTGEFGSGTLSTTPKAA